MAEKIPPHNTEAEKSVLGAAMLNKDALFDVVEIVSPEDFYSKAHQEIFAALRDMYNASKAVDIVTVTEEMKNRGTLAAAGGSAYIAELTDDIPSTTNAAEYAKIIAEKAALRRLIQTSEEIRENCYAVKDTSENIMDFAEKKIFAIAESGQKRDYTPIKDVMFDDMDIISKRSMQSGGLTGITSGFRDLDGKLNGFQKSDLVIIAARPGMGKTAFALNVALNAAEKGNANVLIFSMEMSKEQLGQRLIAMKANVDMDSITKGNLQQDNWNEIIMASEAIGKCNINIDDTPNPTVYEIRNKCRRMKADQGLDLIVIDYLQLMIGKSDNVVQEVSQLTRSFKLIAREIDCPVLLISQLSRLPDQRVNNHRPVLSDLRDSGSIEQDADIVLFLYRDDYYNKESEKPGVCEVNVAKHRNGPPGVVDLTWVARYTKFSDKSDKA